MKFIRRILFFIPVMITFIIACVLHMFKGMYNYCRYGGETVIYDKKTNSVTLLDVYEKLTEDKPNQP